MKIILFLANGFEETEAISPADLLRRAGAEVVLAGIGGRQITGARGITVLCDTDAETLSDTVCDCVILPGGNPGYKNLAASAAAKALTLKTASAGGVVAAICAAPTVLSGWGLTRGKTVSVYPGMEPQLDCAAVSYDKVTEDGNIITSRGMGTSTDFGLALVRRFFGAEKAASLAKQVVFGD